MINKKQDIVSVEDEIGVPPSLLNFNYKLFIRKHVPDIVLSNIPHFDEHGLAAGENFLDVSPTYGHVISHLLKVLMQESKVLQEIISTSIIKKGMVEGLILMLNPKVVGMSSTQMVYKMLRKMLKHWVWMETSQVVMKAYF